MTDPHNDPEDDRELTVEQREVLYELAAACELPVHRYKHNPWKFWWRTIVKTDDGKGYAVFAEFEQPGSITTLRRTRLCIARVSQVPTVEELGRVQQFIERGAYQLSSKYRRIAVPPEGMTGFEALQRADPKRAAECMARFQRECMTDYLRNYTEGQVTLTLGEWTAWRTEKADPQ